eukprot:gene9057-6355_t
MQKSPEERYRVIRSVGEECIQENELRNLIEKKPGLLRCYDGFEPSGRMHIAQGIFKSINVNKCTSNGCRFIFWVADWFALMNEKVGGSLENIQTVGKYLIEVWKAAGMEMENVEFLWTSEQITTKAEEYWKRVLDIGRRNSVARIKKCCTIMGKQEGTLTGAQVLYPLMQCSDIFFLNADICQLGLDQRKVNMLAREYCDLIKRKNKPVILSHHMLSGLKQNQAKMSKSDPDSAIFMEDSAEDVVRKINQAYCPRVCQQKSEIRDDGAPVSSEEKNPVLDYFECIVFSRPEGSVTIGGTQFQEYVALEDAFVTGRISEAELKSALAATINEYLEPVRQHFATDSEARRLLEAVKSFRKGNAPIPTETVTYVPSETPVACVWVPCTLHLPLDTCVAIVESVHNFLELNSAGEVQVILPDWSSFVADELGGEEKYITAALQFNLTLLQSNGLPSTVKIVKESDFIFKDTFFWVGAINVGRKFTLNQIEECVGSLRNAGDVISTLMRVATAVRAKATHVITTSFDKNVHSITAKFTSDLIHPIASSEGQIPLLIRPGTDVSALNKDDILYASDSELDVRRKIKKAYCAPNESTNPVIDLACYLLKRDNGLSFERGEEHGGSVSYDAKASLVQDCASGSLHPGDLKATVTKQFVARSATVQALLKTPDMKKLMQVLQAAEKKMQKN